MSMDSSAYAYLVKAYLLTSSGALLPEPDTVCFDLDLALEIAETDRTYAAGLAVYALGVDGGLLADFPLVSHGMPVPLAVSTAMQYPHAAVA
ncbi:hypothetical protein ABLE91_15465 [Aquabacter sp. CN5-332]|uniref:hypothetical protein n=1 Tax=Aquabacter sp. CN5-332 TaxID=3156608 RepID=UPI0032B44887